MPKNSIGTREADKRAIELHVRLKEIEKLPKVSVSWSIEKRKICIANKDDSTELWERSVDAVLSFDVQKARENGGTAQALIDSRRRRGPHLPESEIGEAVQEFFEIDE